MDYFRLACGSFLFCVGMIIGSSGPLPIGMAIISGIAIVFLMIGVTIG